MPPKASSAMTPDEKFLFACIGSCDPFKPDTARVAQVMGFSEGSVKNKIRAFKTRAEELINGGGKETDGTTSGTPTAASSTNGTAATEGKGKRKAASTETKPANSKRPAKRGKVAAGKPVRGKADDDEEDGEGYIKDEDDAGDST